MFLDICGLHGARQCRKSRLLLTLEYLEIMSHILTNRVSSSIINQFLKICSTISDWSSSYLIRFWKAYPSVHCSVKDAPCRTVVKWPSRRRSCMLLSLHAIFSCFDWTYKDAHLTQAASYIDFTHPPSPQAPARYPYLLNEQLLAHSNTLVKAFLTALQHSLLLIDLSAQVTVHLQHTHTCTNCAIF